MLFVYYFRLDYSMFKYSNVYLITFHVSFNNYEVYRY